MTSSDSVIEEFGSEKRTDMQRVETTSTLAIEEPYRITISQVAETFHTNTTDGLDETSVQEARTKFGTNTLGEGERISLVKILAHQVFNAMILVLIISMVIALAIRDWISGGVIAFVVLINVVIGFIQEYKAEKTMGSLKQLTSPTARVIRSGIEYDIPAEEIVPGDIVHIKVGDTIPADLRLFDTSNLETEEAMLTGESLPIPKDPNALFSDSEKEVTVGDRINMAYSSSIVAKGRGNGIVVATGMDTEIGKIAQSLNTNSSLIQKRSTEDGIGFWKATGITSKNIVGNVLGVTVGTPLQKKLSWLAVLLFWIAVLFAIVVMASQRMRVNTEVAIYAICVALSMIPSALIVVLTITMAVGAKVMMMKHVIVRKLDALEALGGVDDICSDKTGTLTQGKMIAKQIWIPNVGTYCVENSNEPFNPTVGEITFAENSPAFIKESDEEVNFLPTVPEPRPQNFQKWLDVATLANIATIKHELDEESGQKKWKAHGDPTEIAIRVFSERLDQGQNIANYEHLAEFPFDSTIKRMSAIYKHKESGEVKVYTKGAVERIVDLCTHWHGTGEDGENFDNQEVLELTSEDKTLISENMDALSSYGLRVLALAYKKSDGKVEELVSSREKVEANLCFLGLVGIYDPPRPESAQSVKLCHRAGISVHMLTGDHPGTAKSISQEVGILPRNLYHYSEDVVKSIMMTAPEFDALTDEEVDNLPVLPLVVARCSPQTKVKMIDALHRRKKFAAMTGDGVNDSPSLKKADIGIAMGQNGSDVAKDVSDIILTDDNFASILNAIEEGRRMSANIQKFVAQLLAENVAQALYLMIGLAFIDETGYSVFPLSPVEVLWILVITSCFPAMGLGQEKASEDILEKPPSKSIFTRELVIDTCVYGFMMAVFCLLTFVIIVYGRGNGDLGYDCNTTAAPEVCNLVFEGRSASFATMTWCALILAWECIHSRNSLFYMRTETDNPWWKQTAIDLWGNKFLFFSVLGGFVSVFPVVYIPVINTKVFLHKPIGYEWGVAVGLSLGFLASCEAWKWAKRIYLRRVHAINKARNPEYDLERNDPFQKAASFSRSATMDRPSMLV